MLFRSLNLAKVPKGVDIARTIACDEWVISRRLADIMISQELTGYTLQPVEHRGARRAEHSWFQLLVTGSAGPTVPPTKFGKDLFHDDPEGEFVCAEHSLSGLKLVSELYIHRDNLDPMDICKTANRHGIRSGVLVPVPMLVVSPRFYHILRSNKIKGYAVEIAHVLDD